MRSVSFTLLLLLLPLFVSAEEDILKLRTSYNPGYMRIVLEGGEPALKEALINQKGQDIVVTLPDAKFTIQADKSSVAFKKIDRTIVLSPGEFRGLKVLTLENPYRLVLDVYKESAGTGLIPAAAKSRTIVLDPGHGGYEFGIVKNDSVEKNVVLDIARIVGARLQSSSFRSSFTRGTDLYMSQGERIKASYSQRPDVFLSLHVGNHKEIEIYMPVITGQVSDMVKPYLRNRGQEPYMKKTVTLLNSIREAVTADLGSDMVTVKPLPYSFLSQIEAAALMIELPSFESAQYDDEFKQKMAATLARGISLYEESEAK